MKNFITIKNCVIIQLSNIAYIERYPPKSQTITIHFKNLAKTREPYLYINFDSETECAVEFLRLVKKLTHPEQT